MELYRGYDGAWSYYTQYPWTTSSTTTTTTTTYSNIVPSSTWVEECKAFYKDWVRGSVVQPKRRPKVKIKPDDLRNFLQRAQRAASDGWLGVSPTPDRRRAFFKG